MLIYNDFCTFSYGNTTISYKSIDISDGAVAKKGTQMSLGQRLHIPQNRHVYPKKV